MSYRMEIQSFTAKYQNIELLITYHNKKLVIFKDETLGSSMDRKNPIRAEQARRRLGSRIELMLKSSKKSQKPSIPDFQESLK